ncbi:hypothetical protein Poli38472_003631 [Pythium oligandrum]|uniref:Uncharacterized protein n=1 Tax=Pythium oligandrum TaxID=41045 RepID=A0A8K1FKB3_PYTOL|nr:hypothetical protein Poli38472_003631 [Pythium oligandrum]|eukprot:TMW65866.1 hypothetical protein Poli38472_003631 [Pythium oligandrum]
MKLSSVLSTVGLLCFALVNAADVPPPPPENRTFEAPRDKDGRRKIKTGAQFGKTGARIDVCPSGDCTNGQMISLSVSRIEEFKKDGTKVVTADTTNKGANAWLPIETTTINGVSAAVTSFAGDIVVNSKTAKFNLSTIIFESTSWAMNGQQNLTVPAGALKFSVSISSWPFAEGAADNYLQFAVKLKAKSKNNSTALGPPERRKGNATHPRDTVDMGEGMYMDAPTNAVIDGTDTSISAEINSHHDVVEYVWKFPQFKTGIYYDPVVGTTDASASVTTDSSSGVSVAMVASSLIAGLAALSFAFF